MATTTVAPGRKRRQTESDFMAESDIISTDSGSGERRISPDIVTELLPVLSVVAHARDGLIPLNCTFRSICEANKMLVNKFGDVGRSVAALMSSEIGKTLIAPEPRRGPVTMRRVNKVAQLGRSGLPCNIIFKDCDALSFLPSYVLPSQGSVIPMDHPLMKRAGVAQFLEPLQNSISEGPLSKQFSLHGNGIRNKTDNDHKILGWDII